MGEGDRVSGGGGWLQCSHPPPTDTVILTPGEESWYMPTVTPTSPLAN